MIQTQEAHQFDATLEGAPTGLTGTLGVRLVDPSSNTTLLARQTTGISEYPEGSGVYGVTLTAPAIGNNPSPWTISVLWDTVPGGSPLAPDDVFTEDLIIYGGPVPATPGLEGTPYFTADEFRARYPDLADDTKYPDSLVDQYRELAEQAFEDACQRAFVPRTATETIVEDRGNRWLQYTRYDANYATPGRYLGHSDVRRILSATDSTNTPVDLGGVQLDSGWVYGLSAYGSVTITYEYGADQPPLRVKQAVMSLAREWMVSGPVTDRQTGIPVEGGGTISLAVPGGRYGTFGIPEVDATVQQYGAQVFVA